MRRNAVVESRSSGTRHYGGTYDSLTTYRRLRDAGVLGAHSYLHMGPAQAEIGWAPLDRLQVLDGVGEVGWHARLERFADTAARLHRHAAGYVGFDAVDQAVGSLPDGSGTGWPLVEFIIPGELITFRGDQVVHRTEGGVDLARYLSVREPTSVAWATSPPLEPVTRLPGCAFMAAVEGAAAALSAGEAQKVVLSRYQAYDVPYDPVALFAEYCLSQSFVDAYLVHFDDVVAIIASPEALLTVSGGELETNPLAGTRPRGRTLAEDERLRAELRTDRKELAEHVLSVTTMLDELGPLCAPKTLAVSRLLDICLQQEVQHLSSTLTAQLAPGRRALEALWALFPSVTVTGLPKAPALALLRRLEDHPRALYAGTVGWAAGRDDCRFSLAIRGVFRYGRRSFLHAGAGIMAESRPEAELAETAAKLRAMEVALAHTAGVPACV